MAPPESGSPCGNVISKYKTAEHFDVAITDDNLTLTRHENQIDTEAALDGFCVLRTPLGLGQVPRRYVRSFRGG